MSTTTTQATNRDETNTNRDESVVKNTHEYQGSTDTLWQPRQITDDSQKNHVDQVNTNASASVPNAIEQLDANEQKFTSLLAQGYTGTQAYRLAYPHKSKLKNSTVRYNVVQLLAKPNIQTEIEVKRTTLAQIARLTEDRIIETLTEAKTGSKSLTDTMLAMYEHANGKAKQTTEVISKSVSVNIDLTAPLTE